MKNRRLICLVCAGLVGMTLVSEGCKKDDSTPAGPAAPTNSFAFNTEDGNFAASGAFNAYATSGSGAGWMSSNTLAAYSIVSPTNVSVVAMVFVSTPAVGTLNFPTGAVMTWSLNVNPNDTASVLGNQCITKAGSLVISAHGSGTSRATFTGSGARVRNQADTCAITNGAFTIYTTTAKAASLPPEVERIARKLVEPVE